MIRYNLICTAEHEFEGWFSSSADYDDQAERGLLCCPICATTEVEKAIMAPAIKTARKTEARAEHAEKAMSAIAAKIRGEIGKNCENVGANFAEEARAIHYGEKPERGIYGSATRPETEALKEEGIEAHPLPDAFVPEPDKTKLN
jgi:hypothetical protein